MSNAKILVFCGLALLVSVGLGILAVPFASVSADRVQQAQIPMPVEDFQQPIAVGHGHGEVSVSQLMEYYVEHPPKVAASAGQGGSAPAAVQFGGC